MSQFHFSDEDPKDAPSNPPSSQPPQPAASPLTGNEELPAKPSPFQLDDDEPKKPVAKAKAAETVAPPQPPAPVAPAAKPTGPRPLQPRPNAAMPPKTVPNKGAAPTIPHPIPQEEEMTAQSMINDEPLDGFSAFLTGFGTAMRQGLDMFEAPAIWVLRIAVPIGALCLAYILAAVFLGAAKAAPTSPQYVDLVKNLTLASTGLKFCLIAAGVSALLITYDDNRLGIGVAGLGIGLHFFLPIGIKAIFGNTIAGAVVAQHMRVAGFALLIVGLIKATADFAVFLYNLPDTIKAKHASIGAARQIEAKQQRIARDANMFSPCWNLPFCREAIRKMCPAFLARKTCWKFGRGCYCDEEMISRIVRGESLERIKAPTRVSQSKKPPCGRCYIFLEHQTYKFRMLSPLALPAAVALTYTLWVPYTNVFKLFDKSFASIFNSLSFSATNVTPDIMKASQGALDETAKYSGAEMAAYWAQNLLGVLLGFMLLIYISKAIEYVVFKAKL